MGARILVIEDNSANLDLLIFLLTAFGHEPFSAVDGLEGLEAAKRLRPDLVVCDLQLPKVSGYDVARRLKAEPDFRAVPLIAVTAYAMPGDREKALSAGFDGYIAKPIAPEAFHQQLNAFLPTRKHAAPPDEQAATAAPKNSSAHRATLLLVDDSPVNIELVRSTLEPAGYLIVACNQIGEAVEYLGRNEVDLIISDLHMPGGDGFELLRILKVNPEMRDIPAIVMSSTVSGSVDRATASALGAAGFIVRPVEPAVLLDHIDSALRARAAAQPI